MGTPPFRPLLWAEIDGVVCPAGNAAQTLGTGHTSLEGLGLHLFSLEFRKRRRGVVRIGFVGSESIWSGRNRRIGGSESIWNPKAAGP